MNLKTMYLDKILFSFFLTLLMELGDWQMNAHAQNTVSVLRLLPEHV